MTIHTKLLGRDEFYACHVDALFGNSSADRSFAIVRLGDVAFKFSWQSDLIEPFVLDLERNRACIGVDQDLVIVDFSDKTILLKLGFDSNLLQSFLLGDVLCVVSEMLVVTVSLQTFQVLGQYDLPDICTDVKKKEGAIEVHCMDGQSLTISL